MCDGVQDDYYYFHRFKMELYNSKDITSTMTIKDAGGKYMYAVEVFAFSIKALKDHLEEHLKRNKVQTNADKTKWILTVPAIWTDAAKQFMRKSGEMAGIPHNKLFIALEPEVASVYCQCFPPLGGLDIGSTGSKYLIADLGGGTVDITAHETLIDGSLKELTKAYGKNCGGNMIENHFIEAIFGSEFLEVYKKQYPDSYVYLLRCFESKKRTIQSNKSGFVNVTVQYTTLDKVCETKFGTGLREHISLKFGHDKVKVYKDKIRIDLMYAKSLFTGICKDISLLVQDVLQRVNTFNLKHIVLVGGFAKCWLIHEYLQTSFPKLDVIVPEDSDLAVLKGSVLFGYKPDIISYRIIRYAYVILATPPFIENVHDVKRKIYFDGSARCNNVFVPFMESSTLVSRNTEVKRRYNTSERFQTGHWIQIFYTEKENTQYTDDISCRKLGELIVNIPTPSLEKRSVDVVFHFGDTELTVTACDTEAKTKCSVFFNII
ncbi:Hypothetical predicted protein [Mytilus galloprovincialis]|nr:Hypothetical predicted protein [Mytilus galloprovincialis]